MARSRALVVEDDLATRDLLAQLLEALDCDVDTVSDGESALVRIRSHDYDVVLLDIALPKMSGIEVMEALRGDLPHALGCVIVVTGLDVLEIRSLFPAVHETLAKPVMPSRLRQAVRSCLARTRPAADARVDERMTPR